MRSFFLFLVILFFNYHNCFALTLLEDNFNDGSATDGSPVFWDQSLGSYGSWTVENGEYVGYVIKEPSQDLPTYAITGNNSWDNYRFTVRVKGDIGLDKVILFRYHSLNETYAVKLISSWWDTYGDKITLLKNNLVNWWGASASYINTIGVWYTLSVEVNLNNIKIFINNSTTPILDYTDTNNPILNGKIGLLTWPGSYGGNWSITQVRFDDVQVTTINSSTPSPTPTPLPPVVILPGLGSSWNADSLLKGQNKPQSEWTAFPLRGMDIYQNLIQTLKNAGYSDSGPNQNLFLFFYDWTKPISLISDDLKNYINNVVNPPPDTKVDLIGHSLGGMVARTYIQNNSENPIDKLITLSSPHQGAPSAYYAWEGGQLDKLLGPFERIGAGLFLYGRNWYYPTRAKEIQSIFPVIKDLLPTFNYLKKGNTEVNLDQMNQKNDWLINLNSFLPDYLTSYLNAFVGNIPNSVIEWIPVSNQTWLDKILGLWPDGRPTDNNLLGTGDKYVLVKSGQLAGANIYEINNADHSTIVSGPDSLRKVLEVLGLPPQQSSNSNNLTISSYLVFYLASPAVISGLFDNNHQPIGTFEGKMGIVPDPPPGKYQVQITGTGNGKYKLIVGQINQNGKDYWTDISGSIVLNQIKSHFLLFSSNNPLTFLYPEDYLNSIKTKLNELNISNIYKTAFLMSFNKQKYEDAIILLYNVRVLTKDFSTKNKIQEIIDQCELLYLAQNSNNNPYPSSKLVTELKSAQSVFQTMENLLKIKGAQGKTIPEYGQLYLLSQDKLNQALGTKSYESHIKTLGSKMLSTELLYVLSK